MTARAERTEWELGRVAEVAPHGLEGEESEYPDHQRQPELCAAEADEPAENADTGAGGECRR